jgi:hypothetical protein
VSQSRPITRVDHWLKERYPALSGRHIEEAIEAGLVRTKDWKKTKKGKDVDGELDCTALETHLEVLKKGNSSLVIPIVA